MTTPPVRGPIVIDADVYGAELFSGSALGALTYARLRVDCERIGQSLSQREDDANRSIAATALRLGVPLVSNDGIFHNTSGLLFETRDPSKPAVTCATRQPGPRSGVL